MEQKALIMNQPRWLWIFNSISTTNLRIFFTLFLAGGTAIKYWFTGEVPVDAWLYFIGALAGIDTAQFASKRATYKANGTAQVQEPDVTLSTDIKELSQQKG